MNIILIVVTVLISILAFNNAEWFDRLKFNAYFIKHQKQGWRFGSYALVHAGWLHLLVNMWVLYSFGDIVEQTLKGYFGNKALIYYLLLYAGGALFSALYDFRKQKDNIYRSDRAS